jgi:PAS domain S-box-containing protein
MRDAIIATDNELNITNWNKAAENMFGWRAEEVLGKEASSEVRTRILDFVNNAETLQSIAASGSWKGKIAGLKKDGSRIFSQVSVEAVWNSAGEFNGIVSTHSEITAVEETKKAPVVVDFNLPVKEQAEKLAKFPDLRQERNHELKVKENPELSESDFLKLQSSVKELTEALGEQVKYVRQHTADMEKLTCEIKRLDETISKEMEMESKQPSLRLKEAITAFMDYSINPRFYREGDCLKLPATPQLTPPEQGKKAQRQN